MDRFHEHIRWHSLVQASLGWCPSCCASRVLYFVSVFFLSGEIFAHVSYYRGAFLAVCAYTHHIPDTRLLWKSSRVKEMHPVMLHEFFLSYLFHV